MAFPGHTHFMRFWLVSYLRHVKKRNKCFSGHFSEKQIRQSGFYFPKKDEATFLVFHGKLMRHLFLFILSIKMLTFFFIWPK